MIIKLPIPIYHNNEVFCDEIEIKKPNAGCIADTKKMSDSGDMYGAIAFFISSCTEAMTTKNGTLVDRMIIKTTTRNMPYRSAEYVFTQIMLLRHPDDGIEGVYSCPRCGERLVCEAKKDPVSGELITDTRDFVHELDVTFAEGLVNIEYALEEPVVIKTTDGRTLESIESFVMRHPTLADAIAGSRRTDKSDDLRSQFGIYIECLVEVNGQVVDNKWKNSYGMLLFERADLDKDIVAISKLVNQYGMEKRKSRKCPACGKEWRSIVNTSNFFDLEAQLT
jgi:hypothetical protein